MTEPYPCTFCETESPVVQEVRCYVWDPNPEYDAFYDAFACPLCLQAIEIGKERSLGSNPNLQLLYRRLRNTFDYRFPDVIHIPF